MTGQVDFYVLNGTAPQGRWKYACRLAEKAWLRGMRVVILGEDADAVRSLDQLLWTFSDHSFVPHDDTADSPVRVLQTLPAADTHGTGLLVNLSPRMPPEPGGFARIAEVLDADPERRRLGRERFREYRDLKFELKTHQIDATADPQVAA